MAHLRTLLALTAILAALPAALFAQGALLPAPVQAPNTTFQGTASQLEGHPFRVNGLLVTATSIHVGGGLSNFHLTFRIENTTAQFTTIAGKDLAIVGADGEQFVAYTTTGGKLSASVAEVRVAPART